ncbi:hypothetical protein HDU97_003750 [Phlyctochytrium planicorne]|nr:hypothetical protein HDU97_003750 [Phlyctochytrium planicorne]
MEDEEEALAALMMMKGSPALSLPPLPLPPTLSPKKRKRPTTGFVEVGAVPVDMEEQVQSMMDVSLPSRHVDESDVEEDGIVGGVYALSEVEEKGLKEERVKRQKTLMEAITSLIHQDQTHSQNTLKDLSTRLSSAKMAILVAKSKLAQSRQAQKTLQEGAKAARVLRKHVEKMERKVERAVDMRFRGLKGFLEDSGTCAVEIVKANGTSAEPILNGTSHLTTSIDPPSSPKEDSLSSATNQLIETDDAVVTLAVQLADLRDQVLNRYTRFYRFLQHCTGMSGEEVDRVVEVLGEDVE